MLRDMIHTIKNYIIPAVKTEVEKTCVEYIDTVLYSKPVDLSKPGCSAGGISGRRIRVIGPIVTIY